jgi:hypothetical protein
MSVDQLPFIITIMALAINLLHLTLPKGPFRGFYYYAVKPFFQTLQEANRLLVSESAMLKVTKKGSSLFSVGRLLGGFGLLSATLRLLKVESGINGILPAGGGPLPFIPFLS